MLGPLNQGGGGALGMRGLECVVNLYTVEYSGSRPTKGGGGGGGEQGYYPKAPKLV